MGLFTAAKCPVDDETKVWLEDSFNWLIEELSSETLLANQVVLPTEEFFPDQYRATPGDIRKMLERVCHFMDIEPRDVELEFYRVDPKNTTPVGTVGTKHPSFNYQKRKGGKFYLKMDIALAANPEHLVASVAHELGHVILIGERRIDAQHADYEPLTDLITVFYGLGVFSANAAFTLAQSRNAEYHGGPHRRTDYLTEEMYGYALALFAYARGESGPKWAKNLNVNVKHYFKQGLKYLGKTGDFKVTMQKG